MHSARRWIMVIALSSAHSEAQVTLDGTLGRAGALPGPDYAITADLGRQVGGNLFHSFQTFSIQRSESATFSGPPSVSNIISRVTGGQVSTIDGALRSTIPGAHLYLLNPAGVLFGEHARLEVPGSVHVSTADYLRLSDGGRFDAGTPANSVLTVAPVEAFGFLGTTPGRIEIQGSFLQAPAGQTLSLIGGNLRLINATVYAPAGRLNIAAIGSAGEVIPTDQALLLEGFDQLGTLTMARDSSVERIRIDQGGAVGRDSPRRSGCQRRRRRVNLHSRRPVDQSGRGNRRGYLRRPGRSGHADRDRWPHAMDRRRMAGGVDRRTGFSRVDHHRRRGLVFA